MSEDFTPPIAQMDFTFPPVQINADQTMRDLRDKTLRDDIDSINPIRYAGLTTEQQQELADYRQALLDLPQQATWPNNIVWPTKPSWM